MAVLTVKDINQKEFQVDNNTFKLTGDITDSDVSNITDRARERLSTVSDLQVVDSEGNQLDSSKLISDIKNGSSNIKALLVDMEATHSGRNHNFAIYYEDSMEKDAETFLNPFNKPFLMNHNDYSEPMGRIIKSYHGDSKLTDERSAIHLRAKVTDSSKFEKFLDGRYRTVSIGGSMGTVTCSICGKTILKDNKFTFCGHWRGQTYKNEICYWGARDIDYNEVSVVNNPADDFAQIMKVTVVTNSDNKNDNAGKDSNQKNTTKEENNMYDDGTNTVDEVKQKFNALCDMIDSMLSASNSDQTDAGQTTDAQTGNNSNPENNNTSGEGQPEVTPENASEDQNAKIAELEKTIQDKDTEIATLNDKVKAIEEEKTKLTTELDSYKEKCFSLASMNKEIVVDSIIKQELIVGVLSEDNKDSRKEELLKLSMKELDAIEIKKPEGTNEDANTPHTVPTVNSPVLAEPDGDGSTTDSHNDNSKVKSIDDFTQEIVSKLYK